MDKVLFFIILTVKSKFKSLRIKNRDKKQGSNFWLHNENWPTGFYKLYFVKLFYINNFQSKRNYLELK